MTTVINFLGGPSCGKSTNAAELYAIMKHNGYKVELVREVAKEWAWEGRTIGPFDQMAILGEQIRRESSLYNKVDYVITDSPALLGAFYFDYNHHQYFMNDMIIDYYKYCSKHNVLFKNYLLPRKKKYDTNGRYQSEEDAKKLDKALIAYLNQYGFSYKQLEASPDFIAKSIFNDIEHK